MSTSRRRRKILVKDAFTNKLPKNTNYEIIEEALPDLKKNQFMLKAEYISVDPYQRSFSRGMAVPYLQFAFQVGTVIQSEHPHYPVNKQVVAHAGWSDYTILDGRPDKLFNMVPYIPPTGELPLSLAIGAVGMPGMTAYLGLMEICKPAANQLVCVTSAAGTVGSLVGQISKINGCTVIGFAGSDNKVRTLKEELEFDHAFNYKTEKDIKETLHKVAPNGIDVFFDNVGGPLSAAILECMKSTGRVAFCGAISEYGEAKAKHPKTHRTLVTAESFSFTQWNWDEQLAAITQLAEWIKNKRIIAKETVVTGFEKLPDALIGLLNGDYIGKVVVKV